MVRATFKLADLGRPLHDLGPKDQLRELLQLLTVGVALLLQPADSLTSQSARSRPDWAFQLQLRQCQPPRTWSCCSSSSAAEATLAMASLSSS